MIIKVDYESVSPTGEREETPGMSMNPHTTPPPVVLVDSTKNLDEFGLVCVRTSVRVRVCGLKT